MYLAVSRTHMDAAATLSWSFRFARIAGVSPRPLLQATDSMLLPGMCLRGHGSACRGFLGISEYLIAEPSLQNRGKPPESSNPCVAGRIDTGPDMSLAMTHGSSKKHA